MGTAAAIRALIISIRSPSVCLIQTMVRVDAALTAFLQQFLIDLIDCIRFVRAGITDCPRSVGLILIDDIPVCSFILVDAERLRSLVILPDEKAHPKKRHIALCAVFLELIDCFRMNDYPGRVLNIVRIGRSALGAETFIGTDRSSAVRASAGRCVRSAVFCPGYVSLVRMNDIFRIRRAAMCTVLFVRKHFGIAVLAFSLRYIRVMKRSDWDIIFPLKPFHIIRIGFSAIGADLLPGAE